jgi:hypothetical protein
MSDLSLLWTLVTIVGSVFASVWLAAWRLKGHLTGAELAGVRAENAAHTAWRQYAEAQAKQLEGQLAEAKATNATLQQQIASGANKEVLADTAASSSRSIVAAGTMITNFIEAARLPKRPTWETYHLQPIGSPQPPTKGLLDESPKGLLD